jgi:predicted DCC family thiol-disulfide oxidoreductase YuxK
MVCLPVAMLRLLSAHQAQLFHPSASPVPTQRNSLRFVCHLSFQLIWCHPFASYLRNEDMNKNTLFYDDHCPVCTKEMAKLRKYHDEKLELVAISTLEAAEQHRLLSKLHIQTSNGRWVTGLEANVLAWQHTTFRCFVSILLWPGVRWLAEIGYRLWLNWYQWQRRRRVSNETNNTKQH